MNRLLKEAIAEAERLPEDEQETIASLILEEVNAERGWDERFAKTQDKLAAMARRAREQIARGEVFPFDPSNRP